MSAARVHRLKVSKVERIAEDAVAISFEVPMELSDAYRFIQGQHVALAAPALADDLRRSYSICAPATSGELRVAVKHIPGGVFSSYATTRLEPGDELDVVTPSGRFFTPLDPTQAKHYVAIAAGSGITPILSIAATTLEIEERSSFTLLYGNRTSSSVMFLEELCDLKNRFPDRFQLLNVLSREQQEAELLHGRIDGDKLLVVLGTLIDYEAVDEWFLCGPMQMVEELRSVLVETGVDPRHVHRELFYAGPAVSTAAIFNGLGELSTVTVILDGRTSIFELDCQGTSILDAALRVRTDAPYACKGGVCGTCRARVTEGEVEMDGGYALEADELEAGFVLACQAHPRSERVTLDFDC